MIYSLLLHLQKYTKTVFVLLFMLSFNLTSYAVEKESDIKIEGIFLTWKEDPTTTIAIDIHTLSDYQGKTEVSYRLLGRKKWMKGTGEHFPFPFMERTIHRMNLRKLKPGRIYEFTFGSSKEIYRFRTMPTKNVNRPVRFIVGGDTMHEKEFMDQTNSIALSYDPDFIVWGGDLAYANGNPKSVGRWVQWFNSIKENLIDQNNRVIPIVLTIGNHEVQSHTYSRHEGFDHTDDWKLKIAPFFYSLFAYPGLQGYNVLDFGKYLSLVTLDSEQTTPIEGKQSEWLESILNTRKGKVDHIIPVYHVPAYPSNRPFDGTANRLVRENFVPLFEKYNVKLVFENHDHAYKRTYPLLKNKITDAGKGIVYIGDGAWGTTARSVQKEWYLERAESLRHFILVTLKGKSAELVMIDDQGKQFDQYNMSQ